MRCSSYYRPNRKIERGIPNRILGHGCRSHDAADFFRNECVSRLRCRDSKRIHRFRYLHLGRVLAHSSPQIEIADKNSRGHQIRHQHCHGARTDMRHSARRIGRQDESVRSSRNDPRGILNRHRHRHASIRRRIVLFAQKYPARSDLGGRNFGGQSEKPRSKE